MFYISHFGERNHLAGRFASSIKNSSSYSSLPEKARIFGCRETRYFLCDKLKCFKYVIWLAQRTLKPKDRFVYTPSRLCHAVAGLFFFSYWGENEYRHALQESPYLLFWKCNRCSPQLSGCRHNFVERIPSARSCYSQKGVRAIPIFLQVYGFLSPSSAWNMRMKMP